MALSQPAALIRARVILRLLGIARLTALRSSLPSPRPVRRGCFREALLKQDGMRRPASWCMHINAREAPERHRPPATTSGTCERSNATSKGTAHVQRPEMRPRRAQAPINRRGGAPRGERPPAHGLRNANPCGDARTCVIGPLLQRVPMHPCAFRRSASLISYEGNSKARKRLLRENDGAYAVRCPLLILILRAARKRGVSKD
jgi:hypothetical protein